jgi:hypothetical protein
MAPSADQLSLIPPGPSPVRRVRRATEETIKALRAGGRLERVDAAAVAWFRTCADRCDELRGVEGKEFHEAQALRLYGEAEARLRSLGGPQTDAFDQLLAEATGPAPPGHPA